MTTKGKLIHIQDNVWSSCPPAIFFDGYLIDDKEFVIGWILKVNQPSILTLSVTLFAHLNVNALSEQSVEMLGYY